MIKRFHIHTIIGTEVRDYVTEATNERTLQYSIYKLISRIYADRKDIELGYYITSNMLESQDYDIDTYELLDKAISNLYETANGTVDGYYGTIDLFFKNKINHINLRFWKNSSFNTYKLNREKPDFTDKLLKIIYNETTNDDTIMYFNAIGEDFNVRSDWHGALSFIDTINNCVGAKEFAIFSKVAK